MKKTILHIIYNLGRGGAETMLVAVLKELKEYHNIVVTLDPDNHFGPAFECDEYICLHCSGTKSFPLAVIKLRKLIRQRKPDIVHTHLFWPTVIARLATPKKIPLLTTIHAFIATSVEYKHKHIRWIDQITYRLRKTTIIAVAKGALDEYFSFLHLKPHKAYALYTFVDTRIFNDINALPIQAGGKFRLITIGALREQKNHQYLIRAFKELNDDRFELHIYGSGPLEDSLIKNLQQQAVTNVVLKGQVTNINQLIGQYDLFVMSSTFEGFSLGVLEAMALKMPMLLSDIVSFREQCEDTAEYFSLQSPEDFVQKLKQLSANPGRLKELGGKAKQRVLDNFTLDHHMEGLRGIYTAALNDQ